MSVTLSSVPSLGYIGRRWDSLRVNMRIAFLCICSIRNRIWIIMHDDNDTRARGIEELSPLWSLMVSHRPQDLPNFQWAVENHFSDRCQNPFPFSSVLPAPRLRPMESPWPRGRSWSLWPPCSNVFPLLVSRTGKMILRAQNCERPSSFISIQQNRMLLSRYSIHTMTYVIFTTDLDFAIACFDIFGTCGSR